jgi:hypothetical protein
MPENARLGRAVAFPEDEARPVARRGLSGPALSANHPFRLPDAMDMRAGGRWVEILISRQNQKRRRPLV